MAILNFPDNPLTGAQYTGDNGTTYIYDGTKWIGRAAGGAAGTNSIQNGSYTVQVDVEGDLVLPVGSIIKDSAGNPVGGGGTGFTIGTVDLHNGGVTTAQKLQFDDTGYQSVITGPTPNAGDSANRLIIQGQRATGQGEGGDVYVWGGDSQVNGGDIKIYAGDADSNSAGDGGYVNISAGYGHNNGGDITLTAGGSQTNPGDVNINTDSGNWTFGHNGELTLPANSVGDSVLYSTTGNVELYTNNGAGSSVKVRVKGTGDVEWTFNEDGSITFPDKTTQTTAYTGQTGDANIWVQDFETTEGAPADVVGMASSVEYLANGDIIALFVHYVDFNQPGDNRYSGVARFSPTGEKLWSMRFQGSQYTDGWGLAVDNDGGFIYVAGRSSGSTPYEQATLTKLTQDNGTLVWSKYYDVGYDNTNSVVDVATDGNPVVVGYANNGTDTQIVTSKISSVDGSIIWSKSLNGQGYDEAYGMAVGPSGEVVAVGYMDRIGINDAAATLYTEPASNANWTTGVGGSVGGVNFSFTITDGIPTFTNVSDTVGNHTVDDVLGVIGGQALGGANPADNMTVKVATLAANDENNRILIAKYAANGSIAWQKAVTVDAGFDCNGADADIDGDGNIYVCGSFSIDSQSPWLAAIIIIKFNSSGVKQWTRKVQGDCEDSAASIVVGPDNCLYLSAVTGNNNNGQDYSMVVAKYTIDGLVAWQRLLDNTTTWTFAGGSFFGSGGSGSTIAVRTGYVAVVGGFGDPGDTVPHAILAQFDTAGTVFPAGNYDFKAASFSGLLNSSASNIVVFDADKTASDYAGTFDVFDFDPGYDADIIVGTLYAGPGVSTGADLIGDGAVNKTGYKYTVYGDSEGYQGGESNPGVVVMENSDHPYTVGDVVTFRNGEQRTITEVVSWDPGVKWIKWSGSVPGNSSNPRFPITVQSSNYVPETRSTARIKPDLTEANDNDHYMKIYAGNTYNGPVPVDPGTPSVMDSLHIHMAGAQENVELFLGTDANYVSTKEAGDTPAGVRLHSEVDVSVVDTDLRLDRKGSTWVSVYGDGENVNLRNNTYDLSWNTIAVDDHGDYYVGGEANQWSEAIVNKYSRDGQLLWSKYNNGDDVAGWQFDGVAYHNNQVATLVQTDFDREYSYYKLSVHNSDTGDLISTTDIYDPDGRLDAYSMIHHSTLGWTVVGRTRGEVATSSSITDTNNPSNYDAIRLLASACLLDGYYPENGSGWRITGTNITGNGQSLNDGVGYFVNKSVVVQEGSGAVFQVTVDSGGVISGLAVTTGGTNYRAGHKIILDRVAFEAGLAEGTDVIITVTNAPDGSILGATAAYSGSGSALEGVYSDITGTGYQMGSGARARVYMDYNTGYYSVDYIETGGSNYVNLDNLRVLGSELGGVDGGLLLVASMVTTNGAISYFSKATYPTLNTTLNAVSGGAFARFLGNNAMGRVTAVTDNGDGNWSVAVTMTRGEAVGGDMAFFAGNDLEFTSGSTGVLNNTYNNIGVPSLQYIYIDMNLAGGYVSTAFKDGTFVLTRQRSSRPWIWTNDWTRYLDPVEDSNNLGASGQAYCVAEDPLTQDLVVGGYIDTPSHSGGLVWKINSAGTTQWAKTIDGDDENVYGVAVSSIDSSIYVSTYWTAVHKLDSSGALIKTVGTYGPWGLNNPEVKLSVEEDGFEYVYVGGQGGSIWGSNYGFYLSKLTDNLITVWGRSMWHDDDNLSIDYDNSHTKFVLGKGQASIVGYGYPYSNNYTNALIYTISTEDTFKPVSENLWYTAQNGDHVWITTTGFSMYNIIGAGATANTGTTDFDTSTTALAWNNYAFQSRLLNLNSEQRGIVGVETIEFADGGTLDHNPADIPPSQWFDPENYGWEYTLQLSDRGRFIMNQTVPNDSGCQDLYVFVPRNDQVSFPVGTVITLINSNSSTAGGNKIYVKPIDWDNADGQVRIWSTNGNQNSSIWSFQGIQTATLMKISTNAWLLTANNLTDED